MQKTTSLQENYLSKSILKEKVQLITNYTTNDFVRKQSFEILSEYPDEIYKVAYKGYLSDAELERVHGKYSKYYFEKLKRSFHNFYRYCSTFSKYLNEDERKLLIKKLINKKYSHNISRALEEIYFSETERDKLLKYCIILKLILALVFGCCTFTSECIFHVLILDLFHA